MNEHFIVYAFATSTVMWRAEAVVADQSPPAGAGIVAVSEAAYALADIADIDPVELRAGIWEQVKAKREALLNAGAPTSFGTMDADLVSRVNIGGAATGALAATVMSQPFSINWTTTANAVVTLTAAQMIQMGMEVMAYVSGCHDRARALRAEIEAAADATALLQIDYTAGWP